MPVISTTEFDALEAEIRNLVTVRRKELYAMWSRVDYNGNGMLSLAEIDNFIEDQYPLLDNKPALIRAFYFTTLGSSDPNAWKKADFEHSFVRKNKFCALLRNIFYFNKLWAVFDEIDEDDDRRISLREFVLGSHAAGLSLSPAAATAKFRTIDTNGGGFILFSEFVTFVAQEKIPVD
eukprot:gnl/Dysnectes_brevis/325_a359_8127.p1 GENE.gnl/Dysnectes_brevis/325_a359_8127~~gnl/Dysnectes_brevis/325_a359_8127.p1  ORF type:complete len:178 (-),score=46.57 gnl/Dysnectes_brevis/325_a359_8127:57-590(-)